MKKLTGMAGMLLLIPQLASAQWADPHEGEILILGGYLFDGISEERRPNTGIVIQNGKIIDVDADLEERVVNTAGVLQLTDADTRSCPG
jgi:hypothetical protein